MITSTYILNSAGNTGQFVIKVADNKDQVVIKVPFRKEKEKKFIKHLQFNITLQLLT